LHSLLPDFSDIAEGLGEVVEHAGDGFLVLAMVALAASILPAVAPSLLVLGAPC